MTSWSAPQVTAFRRSTDSVGWPSLAGGLGNWARARSYLLKLKLGQHVDLTHGYHRHWRVIDDTRVAKRALCPPLCSPEARRACAIALERRQVGACAAWRLLGTTSSAWCYDTSSIAALHARWGVLGALAQAGKLWPAPLHVCWKPAFLPPLRPQAPPFGKVERCGW
jgi:hypothetical protein